MYNTLSFFKKMKKDGGDFTLKLVKQPVYFFLSVLLASDTR